MSEAKPQLRWYRLTPDRLVLLLLVVECLLWLSNWLRWLAWHKGYAVLTGVAVVGLAMLALLAWFVVALLLRWRFQFSVRSLLVLATVIAIACGWITDAMKKANRQREVISAIHSSLGDAVSYESDPEGPRPCFVPIPAPVLPPPTTLENLLGTDFFHEAVAVDIPFTLVDEAIAQLKRLGSLRTVYVNGADEDDFNAATKKLRPHLPGVRIVKGRAPFVVEVQAGPTLGGLPWNYDTGLYVLPEPSAPTRESKAGDGAK